MAIARVRKYLQAREGREVPFGELLAAGLAPSAATLSADLSRLAADPRNGITIVGGARIKGTRRSYRYDKPASVPEPDFITLRLIGQSADGNRLAQDDATLRIYELVPRGHLNSAVSP